MVATHHNPLGEWDAETWLPWGIRLSPLRLQDLGNTNKPISCALSRQSWLMLCEKANDILEYGTSNEVKEICAYLKKHYAQMEAEFNASPSNNTKDNFFKIGDVIDDLENAIIAKALESKGST